MLKIVKKISFLYFLVHWRKSVFCL